MDNEFVYLIFRKDIPIVDYDDDNLYLEIIVRTKEEVINYINNNKNKYYKFSYEKIKINDKCYLNLTYY
jgi:hypothetical protein